MADENIEFLSTKLLPFFEKYDVDIDFFETELLPFFTEYGANEGIRLCKEMIDFWSMIKGASFQEESPWEGSSWEKFFSEWKDFSCDTEGEESSCDTEDLESSM